jgi:hypothetical protein
MKNDLYGWLDSLNFESGKNFRIYQESNIYSLILDEHTLATGLTKRECLIAINVLRSYIIHSPVK